MRKHTPGPWVIIVDELSDSVSITTEKRIEDSMVEICEVTAGFWSEKFETEQRANARLIASAPELLEALEWIKDYLDDKCATKPDLAAVIAKARGES